MSTQKTVDEILAEMRLMLDTMGEQLAAITHDIRSEMLKIERELDEMRVMQKLREIGASDASSNPPGNLPRSNGE